MEYSLEASEKVWVALELVLGASLGWEGKKAIVGRLNRFCVLCDSGLRIKVLGEVKVKRVPDVSTLFTICNNI